MLAALRRPVLTRTMASGLLALSAVGFPGAVAEPAAAEPLPAYRVLPGKVLRPKPPALRLPVTGYRLTGQCGDHSGLWSSMHTGLDFAAPEGTPLRSISAGVVESAGYNGSYGYKIVVRTAAGTELWYCHESSIRVSPGQRVRAGQIIGAIGSTGNVTGPHLHLEVRPTPGTPVDPLAWLRARGLRP